MSFLAVASCGLHWWSCTEILLVHAGSLCRDPVSFPQDHRDLVSSFEGSLGFLLASGSEEGSRFL